MELALSAIRWIFRIIFFGTVLATGVVYYMAFKRPGELTGKLFGETSVLEWFNASNLGGTQAPETQPVKTRLADIANRAREDAAKQRSAKVLAKQANTQKAQRKVEETKEYQPPTAQRKTLRVGE